MGVFLWKQWPSASTIQPRLTSSQHCSLLLPHLCLSCPLVMKASGQSILLVAVDLPDLSVVKVRLLKGLLGVWLGCLVNAIEVHRTGCALAHRRNPLDQVTVYVHFQELLSLWCSRERGAQAETHCICACRPPSFLSDPQTPSPFTHMPPPPA